VVGKRESTSCVTRGLVAASMQRNGDCTQYEDWKQRNSGFHGWNISITSEMRTLHESACWQVIA
jgi:hypothetical protein